MKISVCNFKGIEHIDSFDLKDISVMTGVNSGGKSSLIHLLLLIKQSLETRSSETPLKLNRPYISLGRFESVIRKASGGKGFSFQIDLAPWELAQRLVSMLKRGGDRYGMTFEPITGLKGISISSGFRKTTTGMAVDHFSVTVNADADINLRITRHPHGKSYEIESNKIGFFFGGIEAIQGDESGGVRITAPVGFYSFFPDYMDYGDGYFSSTIALDLIRTSVQKYFSRISYIGPLREEPREFYFYDDDFVSSIGNKGENAAYILAKYAQDTVTYKKLERREDGAADLSVTTSSFESAVNYWMCEVFNLARKVAVSRARTNRNIYEVKLKNNSGDLVPISHVGFGISQIFPVLVEVLRPSNGRRLVILEQPEIHLHPRVQSLLFDFILSAPKGVTFLIETHSDHFINRLRLRIAEDETKEILSKVNLTFVVQDDFRGLEYRTLKLNELGSMDWWPDGFFDQYEKDARALVIAQARKKGGLSSYD